MQTHVSQWGNSLGIRLPKSIAESLGLKSGTKLDVVMEDGKVIISPAVKKATLAELVARITPENIHTLEEDAPVGKEVW